MSVARGTRFKTALGILAYCLLAGFAMSAGSAPLVGEILVTTESDDDDIDSPPNEECTLREALQNANSHSQWNGKPDCDSGGTERTEIRFKSPSTTVVINPEFGEFVVSSIVAIVDAATIRGPALPEISRLFYITAAGDLLLFDDDLENGVGALDSGGNVLDEGRLTMHGGSLQGGKADRGAAVAVYGDAELINVEVRANKAKIDGGAFWIGNGSTFTMKDCTVTNNGAGRAGGAFYADPGQPQIDIQRTAIISNIADGDATGGGGAGQLSGFFSMSDSVVAQNIAFGGHMGGAGWYFTAGTNVVISDSDFNDNLTETLDTNAGGGAIRHDGSGAMLIQRTSLHGNTAWVGGGAYVGPGGIARFVNDTISENYADEAGRPTRADSGSGAAVYANNSLVTFINATVKDNDGLTEVTARGINSKVRFQNSVVWTLPGSLNCDGEGVFEYESSLQGLDWVGGSCPMGVVFVDDSEVFSPGPAIFEAKVGPPGIPVEHHVWFPAPGSPLIHAGESTICLDPGSVGNQDERKVTPRGSCDIGAIEG